MSKSYSQENESDKRIVIEVENLQRRLVNLEDRLSESLQKQNYAPTESKSSQASVKSQKKSRHSESKETKTSRPQGDVITQTEKKSEVYVIGDSIVKNLDGRKMARKKNVKVRSFPGATTSDMTDFVKPIIRKKPESVILHVGTNDLKSNPEAQIADNIIELANSIRNQQINCVISLLTYRKGNIWNSGKTVNKIVKRKSEELGIRIIENDNINSSHLNNSGLHLNKRGTISLAKNFIDAIRSN